MDRGIPSSITGREAAIEEALRKHPEWSMRRIARELGVAVTTVIRTKERIEHGQGHTQVEPDTSQYARMRRLSTTASPEPPTQRVPRGRPAATPIAREDAGLIAALGTDLDPVIADRFGVSPTRVRQLREERGVPAFARTRHALVEAAIRAGDKSDAQIARELGVDRKTIRNVRAAMAGPGNVVASAQAEREATIRRILAEHPEWSLRRVATEAGVTANAVMRVKRRGGS